MTHTWNWRRRLPERKGEPCRVLARGRMNSILVEFSDGSRVITSRNAVRRNRIMSDKASIERGQIIGRVKRLRAEIEQTFLDCAHWNANRAAGVEAIDPDPDG